MHVRCDVCRHCCWNLAILELSSHQLGALNIPHQGRAHDNFFKLYCQSVGTCLYLSWHVQILSGHRIAYYATKNHPRASCAWVVSEIAATNNLLAHYCLYWHYMYVWTKLNLYWQIQYSSRNCPVAERYREPCHGEILRTYDICSTSVWVVHPIFSPQ